MKSLIAATAFAVAISLFGTAGAATAVNDGTDMTALRTAMKSDKRAYVANELSLTPGEEKKFWPVYETYQRQLDAVNTRKARLVEDLIAQDRPISDRYAKMLMREVAGIEEQEAKATRQVGRNAQKALPSLKAARYLQIEQKMRAVQAYDIASVMPLVK